MKYLVLEAVIPEVKSEHNGNQQENSAVQGKKLHILYLNYMYNYKTQNKDLT